LQFRKLTETNLLQ